MAHYNPEEPSDVNGDLSHEQLDFHQLMLSRSKLKSTVRTSTILAGFAMVSSWIDYCVGLCHTAVL